MNQEEIILLAKQIIKQEASGVMTLVDQIDENFVKAAQMMLNCKGHVLVSGSGTSHSVARRLAHLLSVCGTPSLLIDAGDSQHGLSGAVTANDVLITLSKGGSSSDVIFLARVAKSRGATVISITEKPESELGKLSDVVLKVVAPPEGDPFGMIATGSSLINAAYGDALCVVLLKLRGYTLEQFGATHPGGAVGKKLEDLKII
ncbi:MAG: SIS domain-containing protein [Pelolinea sp.]|nr:SIS domain-containing protein [Pelolinea sp.]